MNFPSIESPNSALNVFLARTPATDLAMRMAKRQLKKNNCTKINDFTTVSVCLFTVQASFQEKIDKATTLIEQNLSIRIKPLNYALTSFQYFFSQLEDYVQEYTINSPENKELENEWNNFKWNLANLRYEQDPSILHHIREFIQFLKGKYEQIDLVSAENKKHWMLWEIWEKILEEPNLLDLDLAVLTKMTTLKNYREAQLKISVKHLLEAYNRNLEILCKDFSWAMNQIENIFLPYSTNTFPKIIMFDPKEFLGVVEECQKNIAPKLNYLLQKEGIQQIVSTRHSFESVFQRIDNLTNRISNINASFRNKESLLKQFEKMLNDSQQEKIQSNLPDDSTYLVEIAENNDVSGNIYHLTIEEIKSICNYIRTMQQVHVLFECYVYAPFSNLKKIQQSLLIWHQGIQAYPLIKNGLLSNLKNSSPLQQITTPITTSISQLKPAEKKEAMDLDALAASIDSLGSKSHAKVKKDKNSKVVSKREFHAYQERSSQAAKQEKQHEVTTAKKKEQRETTTAKNKKQSTTDSIKQTASKKALSRISLEHVSFSYSKATALSSHLEAMINKNIHPELTYSKIALRQCKLALDDLLVCHSKLEADFTLPMYSYRTHAFIGASYYYLEQLLRYHNIVSNKPIDPSFSCVKHNLKCLFHPLIQWHGLSKTVIDKLYLANFWVSNTHQQYYEREQQKERRDTVIPEILADLYQIAENPDFQHSLSMKKKLEICFNEIVDFSEKLIIQPSDDINESIIPMKTPITFSLACKSHCEVIDLMEEAFQQILSKLEITPQHPALFKIKETLKCLRLLKSVLIELNQPEILSDEFSLLIRHAFYWQNGALEGFLQSLFAVQRGSDTKEHDLLQLSKKISWKRQEFQKEIHSLCIQFFGLNYSSRYPFDIREPNECLKLILQAEFLRECPSLALGYSYSSPNNEITTALNFASLPKKGLNAEEILGRLLKMWKQQADLIRRCLLPELSDNVSAFVTPNSSF